MRWFFQTLTIISALTSFGCTKWLSIEKKHSDENHITTSSDRSQILNVTTEIKDKNVHVSIGDVPKDSELYCELDYVSYPECRDGMVIKDLKPGEYLLHVTAKNGEKTLAVGEAFFRFGVADPETTVFSERNELELIQDSGYENGSAIAINTDFTFKFKTRDKIDCDATFECSHGDRNPSYWRPCTTDNDFSIKSDFLAKGLQYVHARAKCANKIGPVLSAYFYGVEERYFKNGKPVPLTLDFIVDRRENKFIFRLMKTNDCEETKLKYSCSTGGDFEACDNVHINPPDNFRIRAECDSELGPTISRNELDE